jgi:hypothetical protein
MTAQPQLALLPFTPASLAQPRRVALTDPDAQLQAETRRQIIGPLLEYSSDATRYRSLRLKDGAAVTSFTRLVKYTSETSGFSERTLFDWLNAFREGGLPALADRRRCDKGCSRFFDAYPKAKYLAAYLYLDERTSVRVAREAIVRDLQLLEIPPEESPSYETVRAWLKQMPAALTVYARQGRKVYRERMAAYLRRGYTDVWANQIWVGDHCIHDVETCNDIFSDVEWGAPIRLRISAMLDYRSRLLVGASWAWEGSSRAIAATMRRAIFRHGPPEHLYVDNGKDYKKVARGAMPGYLQESPLAPKEWWRAELEDIAHTGFLARLGIAVTHCIPHHPQSKHVERFFRTLHERFDKCWPTYTSGNPFTRPAATSLAMMDHRRLLRAGRVSESRHPLASRFIVACLAWIEEYNQTPHSGEGMEGGSPVQVFDANRNPDQKPAPDPAALALLLAERQTRQVRECAVTLNKRRYQPVDQAGWMTIHERNEREIVVAYDPNDWECAAALDQDGCFLAWLRVEDLVRFAPGDEHTQGQIADSFKTRRGLEKATRQTLTTISRLARSNGAQSPLEAMASRLSLPGDVTGIVTQRKPRFAPETLEPTNDLQPGDLADRLTAALLRRDAGNTADCAAGGEESDSVAQPKEKVG